MNRTRTSDWGLSISEARIFLKNKKENVLHIYIKL